MTEHDEHGRFAKGNKGGPGRPRRATEEKFLKRLVSRVKAADWREIVDTAIQRAKDGDKDARAWLANYLIGLPTAYVNSDVTSNGESFGDIIEGAAEQFTSRLDGLVARIRAAGVAGESEPGDKGGAAL